MKLLEIRRNSLAYYVFVEIDRTIFGFKYGSKREEYVYLPNLRILVKRSCPKYEFTLEERAKILSWILDYGEKKKAEELREISVPVEK